MIHMIRDRPSIKLAFLSVIILVLVGGSVSLFLPSPSLQLFSHSDRAIPKGKANFSPEDDLEDIDVNLIRSAHSSIDVAMYSFTDHRIEAALADAAKSGVEIIIYRDALQYADEESRAIKSGTSSVTDELRGTKRIEVRIKGGGQSMHLKAFCLDGSILRTGSANWSPDGEKRQDNDLYVVKDPSIVKAFEDDFKSLWDRSDNRLLD